MISKIVRHLLVVAMLMAGLGLVGCEASGDAGSDAGRRWYIWGDTEEPMAPKANVKPTAAPAAAPAPKAASTGNGVAFPTGRRESSVLWIERTAPAEVSVGQPFEYLIHVTNLTALRLSDVNVMDRLASNFKYAGSEPEGKVDGNQVKWNLGDFAPNETKTIKVKGSAADANPITNCLAASWDERACIAINVVQPKLTLTASATPEVLACDPITVKYTVCNKGTGTLRDVVIDHALPKGVTTAQGMNSLAFKVPALAADQCQTFEAVLKASGPGKFDSKPEATSGALKADAAVSTTVRKPVLTIKKTGPAKVFVGRTATYEIEVANTGDGDARNATLEDAFPASAKFVSATDGGAAVGNKVAWNLGTLKPKDTKKVSLVLSAGMGKIEDTATARAYCAEAVNASAVTEVAGIPAILLEVVDDPDPIEVGGEVVYTIVATNQGSADGTNIKIVATLEDTMQFVSAGGATPAKADGKTITFEALKSLAPKAKATWTVKVKAVGAGDVRFKTVMTSDQLTRTVEETEATNFYK